MNDIKGTLFNMAKSVSKTSGDLFKSTKLSMNLSNAEADLKNLYLEIGKKVHEIYQYGGSLGKFFDEKYLEIESFERKIAEIKEQISVIKGTKECPKCGKSLERSAEFCHKCGIKVELGGTVASSEQEPVPPAPPLTPPIQEPEPIQHVGRVCRVCNSQNEAGVKFCLSCGRILD